MSQVWRFVTGGQFTPLLTPSLSHLLCQSQISPIRPARQATWVILQNIVKEEICKYPNPRSRMGIYNETHLTPGSPAPRERVAKVIIPARLFVGMAFMQRHGWLNGRQACESGVGYLLSRTPIQRSRPGEKGIFFVFIN